MTSPTYAVNSTIVRTNIVAFAVTRAYFSVVSRLFPTLAGRQLEQVFTTPPPFTGRVSSGVPLARRVTVRSEDRRLAVWEAGTRGHPAVLLVHGWGGRGVQMESFVAPLVARGYRVVWFDQPGHGESGTGTVGLPVFVRALEAIDLSHGPFRAAIGHSLGAAAVGLALRRGLRLARVAFVAAPASMTDYTRRFARLLGIAPWVRDAMRARLERKYGMPFAEIDDIDDLRRLTQPALFVHDADDRDVPFENAIRLASRMPSARLMKTYGLGHHRLLRDEAVVDAIAAFVDGADAPSEWPPLPRPAAMF